MIYNIIGGVQLFIFSKEKKKLLGLVDFDFVFLSLLRFDSFD